MVATRMTTKQRQCSVDAIIFLFQGLEAASAIPLPQNLPPSMEQSAGCTAGWLTHFITCNFASKRTHGQVCHLLWQTELTDMDLK
ncbi:MAG: hypothetical protein J3Q66DRAFT_344255 [Benniella sp.]|nr:MAG: hypothetical protein J3Q66DRAFT_344255 [Benniella sp.]